MKSLIKKIVIFVLAGVAVLMPNLTYAQFGGVVYDPTNYAGAVLRYKQLVQQVAQLKQTYQQVLNQYNLAVQMSKNLKNMPARYRATFSQWRRFASSDFYGNTQPWVAVANGAGSQSAGLAYQRATIPLLSYSAADLGAIHPADALTLKSAYASLELADGASVSALTTVGEVRANAARVQQQIGNLEQDSFSGDPSQNGEVSVLNKINASNVLTLRTLQDSNNIRLATLEQQLLQTKRQRDIDTANLNFAIQMRGQTTLNLAPFNRNLTQTLSTYRLP
jgi:hypothetical protein